jgi:hypothetical protein
MGPADVPADPAGEWVQIANEFTTARVRKVWTRNGERLEIQSAKLGTTIRLDPLELESLTWQDTETFSALLNDPYGPEEVQPRALSELMTDRQVVEFDDRDS